MIASVSVRMQLATIPPLHGPARQNAAQKKPGRSGRDNSLVYSSGRSEIEVALHGNLADMGHSSAVPYIEAQCDGTSKNAFIRESAGVGDGD